MSEYVYVMHIILILSDEMYILDLQRRSASIYIDCK